MELQLSEDYRVKTDTHNYILQERKVSDPTHRLAKSTEPQERWVDVGYYARLDHLIKSLWEKEIKESDIKTLEDFSTFLKDLEAKYIKVLTNEC